MKIAILGTGCPKCARLEQNVRQAASELAIDCEIDKISDIREIMDRGVVMTPALSIDGNVVSSGRLLSVDEIKGLLG